MQRPALKEPKPFITTAEVAALLGIRLQHFRGQREALIEDQAFPTPLPYAQSPMIWRRDMVEAWLAEQGRARALPPSPRPVGPNVVLMEKARQA